LRRGFDGRWLGRHAMMLAVVRPHVGIVTKCRRSITAVAVA
jgi:hypothetical protein